ncbi:MAG TPA: hypothetical protein VJN89_06605 [Candidatus Acidoferrum sp.]|nr:hypothetical protein [Candidatus Acidoferrum sp.]
MEEYPEANEDARSGETASIEPKRRAIGFAVLLAVALLAAGYGYRQQLKVRYLADQESVDNATINDLQQQVKNMTNELNNVVPAQPATPGPDAQRTRKHTSKPASVDKYYEQLRRQLTEQQKQMKETRDLIAKNHRELEWSLNSTRDELNGSIAKTHEEVVALAKRGERSYFEFDLAKSKEFQRFGPLPLSLRKTDTKHNSFDMAMVVDDNQLMKKKVNLYEPIWIHTENQSQPVQVVVNRIAKDLVHGYVSAPKYKPSELAAADSSSVSSVVPPRKTESEPTKPE